MTRKRAIFVPDVLPLLSEAYWLPERREMNFLKGTTKNQKGEYFTHKSTPNAKKISR